MRDNPRQVREGPKSPFAEWPVQAFDDRLGYLWYCHPAALVVQTTVSNGSVAAVRVLNDVIDHVLAVRAGEIATAGGLYLFHDWRTLKSYDKDAQTAQFERMKARAPGYARQTVIVVAPANRLLRMAVETAGLFATVTFGSRVQLSTTAGSALARAGLTPPAAGSKLPASEQ